MDQDALGIMAIVFFMSMLGSIASILLLGTVFVKTMGAKEATLESVIIAAFIDPSKIELVKKWNQDHLTEQSYSIAGCTLRRMNDNEWKINLTECG